MMPEPSPATPRAPGRFLSMHDLVRETSFAEQTIRRWVREGKFPRGRPVGQQRVVWLESEVEDWKAQVLANPTL